MRSCRHHRHTALLVTRGSSAMFAPGLHALPDLLSNLEC